MSKALKTRIIKTLWQYGLNAKSLYISIYEDGSKSYRYDSTNYARNFINTNDRDFKSYWSYVRNPIIREEESSYPSDRYELTIEKYNPVTGETIKSWSTREWK